MKIKLSQSEICLSQRQTLSLADGTGVRVTADAGSVWVTQENDLRDIVLSAGESVTFKQAGKVIVQALAPARVTLVRKRRAQRGASGWLRGVTAAFARLRLPQLASA